MNKTFLLVLALVMTFGMALAAGLGIFSASNGSDPTIAQDKESDATTSKLVEQELAVSESSRSETDAPMRDQQAAQKQRELTEDLKLQEVRDSYLEFPQAFESVVVNYTDGAECAQEMACAPSRLKNEILVNKHWALGASYQDIEYALARAHAELAIARAWPTQGAAQRDLAHVIPACKVTEGERQLAATGNAPAHTELQARVAFSSVEAMKDVIVHVMTGRDAPAAVYPKKMHTQKQELVAQEIASGKSPEIVVQVSDEMC